MPDDTTAARPGTVPAGPETAGTMFAALYGELAWHPWHGPEAEQDAYALFRDRSLAMGWMDDTSAGAVGGPSDRAPSAPGLWAMNDAGWEHPLAAPGAGLVSWFQVEAGPVAADRPLPVQPFLRCAGDATARAGRAVLSAVQVLLPVQGIDASARPARARVPAAVTAGWFAARAPGSRVEAEVVVSAGRDRSIVEAGGELAERIGRLDQDVFLCRSSEAVGQEAVPAPPFDDGFWNGPPLHGIALRGGLAEWSVEAVGWLAEAVADISAGLGVRTPLLFTAVRTPEAQG
ncbi:hypothetical protein O4J56_09835 [Nocardiopsis sp. RSe5-2]|uniref:Enduracididine biosynthesis enzyme MppR n=1 Tax=Nocardiopsis endophytica TaxID=3018445 RepID=A0ABT4U3B6_9ACTN|nr:hypothetical protein [Nocardiopsis endophytica]MDA2810935.1 hypothetical protein [Nocardiopsis endophytica]